MTVEELFRKLSYGELSNHSLSVEGTGTIKKEKHNQVVQFANEALNRLHLRFPLIESSETLTLTGALVHPLDDDVLLVRSIFNAWGGSYTVGTHPVPNTLYVSGQELHFPEMVGEVQVNYQHRHPVLRPIVADTDLTQGIILIEELQDALTAYVAYKVYGNMLTAEALAASANHRNRYEEVCLEAQALGVVPGDLLPQQKFHERGWV